MLSHFCSASTTRPSSPRRLLTASLRPGADYQATETTSLRQPIGLVTQSAGLVPSKRMCSNSSAGVRPESAPVVMSIAVAVTSGAMP